MRRFIEESFPVKEVGIESAREKNIRHGHISTLHIWWARRPLASSRATNYAALIPAPENIDEWNKTREFIINFSKWENSLDQSMIRKAREDILKANGGKPPKILDPFGGGGAIPLEALRLGCEETLPNESKEKKLLDGFLAGKERLRDEITKESSMPKQKRLL